MNGMLWGVWVCVHAGVFCGDLSAEEPVHVGSEVVLFDALGLHHQAIVLLTEALQDTRGGILLWGRQPFATLGWKTS